MAAQCAYHLGRHIRGTRAEPGDQLQARQQGAALPARRQQPLYKQSAGHYVIKVQLVGSRKVPANLGSFWLRNPSARGVAVRPWSDSLAFFALKTTCCASQGLNGVQRDYISLHTCNSRALAAIFHARCQDACGHAVGQMAQHGTILAPPPVCSRDTLVRGPLQALLALKGETTICG